MLTIQNNRLGLGHALLGGLLVAGAVSTTFGAVVPVPPPSLEGLVLLSKPMAASSFAYEIVADGKLTGEQAILLPHTRAVLDYGMRELRDLRGDVIADAQFSVELATATLLREASIDQVLTVQVTHVFHHRSGSQAPTPLHTATILAEVDDMAVASQFVTQVEQWLMVEAIPQAMQQTSGPSLGTNAVDSVADETATDPAQECISACTATYVENVLGCGTWFRLQLHRIFATPYDPVDLSAGLSQIMVIDPGSDTSAGIPSSTAAIQSAVRGTPVPVMAKPRSQASAALLLGIVLDFANRIGPSLESVLNGAVSCHEAIDEWNCECLSIGCGSPCN